MPWSIMGWWVNALQRIGLHKDYLSTRSQPTCWTHFSSNSRCILRENPLLPALHDLSVRPLPLLPSSIRPSSSHPPTLLYPPFISLTAIPVQTEHFSILHSPSTQCLSPPPPYLYELITSPSFTHTTYPVLISSPPPSYLYELEGLQEAWDGA